MGMRPLIGICAALEHARWGAWDQPAFLLPRQYVDHVHRAGAAAVLLAPDPHWVTHPDEALELVDGLMLAGGSDIEPATYGAQAHPQTTGTVAERDTFEIALTRRAFELDMPFLGICRGMQVMNVAAGGTLHQHLPELVGHDDHRRVLGTFENTEHPVSLEAKSLAARAAGEDRHVTRSHHHQGVDRIGRGLVATGRADDGTVEALEAPDRRYALGVQWHPEADDLSRVIASLVEEAATAIRAG